jgi:uncharacterized membrane protein
MSVNEQQSKPSDPSVTPVDAKRRSKWLSLSLSILVAILAISGIVFYLVYGRPEEWVFRVEFVILALAVVGIPCGIKYGTQDKFWT